MKRNNVIFNWALPSLHCFFFFFNKTGDTNPDPTAWNHCRGKINDIQGELQEVPKSR